MKKIAIATLVGVGLLAVVGIEIFKYNFQVTETKSNMNIIDRRELELSLERQGIVSINVIREKLPDEYEILISNLVSIINNNQDLSTLQDQVADEMRKLQLKLGMHIYNSSEELIMELIVSSRELLILIRKNDPENCARFGYHGDMEDLRINREIFKQLNSVGELVFQAIAEGISNPVGRREYNSEDTEKLFSSMLFDGVPVEQIELLVKQDTADSKSCDAIISLYDALIDLEGESGSVVRAFFAKASTGN